MAGGGGCGKESHRHSDSRKLIINGELIILVWQIIHTSTLVVFPHTCLLYQTKGNIVYSVVLRIARALLWLLRLVVGSEGVMLSTVLGAAAGVEGAVLQLIHL